MGEWYDTPPSGFQQFAPALHAARSGSMDAGKLLTELANSNNEPAIAGATAIANLSAYQNQQSFDSIRRALNSEEPLKRLAALTALQSFGTRQRALAFPLLSDPNKAIRIDAARLLASIPVGDLPAAQKKILDDGIAEYIAVQEFNAERPESQSNLGGLFTDLGRFAEAEVAYREAIKLQSQFEPAYGGLAQLFSATQREEQALAVLDEGLAVRKDSALLHHARGLSLIRLRQTDKAIESLAKAARLGAEVARYAYVFAIALNSTGRSDMALAELAAAHRKHPQDGEILMALVTINRDAGNREAAKTWAGKLQEIYPGDPAVQGLLKQL
jgi:tetratricopeptide (TPR) repeat protein